MNILEAALMYARQGWPVFPVKRADKRPYTVHGFKDATTDPEQIKKWWSTWPEANIGVPTGQVSGMFVVDVDNLDNAPPGLPPTRIARTGRGGMHILFKHPGVPVRNSQSALAKGVDVRGDGGYIVAPPSIHENGTQYRWEPGPATLAPAPESVLAKVKQLVQDAPQAAVVRKYPPATPEVLEQARSVLNSMGPAIQGLGGDQLTYQVCCTLLNDFALTTGEAIPLLTEWNDGCQPPWDLKDLLLKLDNARNYAQSNYGHLRDNPLREEWTDPDLSVLVDDDNENSPSDLGNALWFSKLHGANFRFVAEWRTWLRWGNTHWTKDEGAAAAQRAMVAVADKLKALAKEQTQKVNQLSDQLQALTSAGLEAVTTREDDIRTEKLREDIQLAENKAKSYRGRIQMLHSANGLQSALRVAQIDSRLSIVAAAVDSDPMLLNVANGTVDLRTGELREHQREDHLTRITPVHYDPAAQCLAWQNFLATTVAPDVAGYLQRAVGYTLSGSVTAQCLFFLWGNGANGKSTFVNVVRRLLGDYAQTGAASLLEATPGKHPTDVADLASARMVTLTETESNRPFPAALIKTLTSEEPIRTRKMGQDFWQYMPTHKLWISGNHKPNIHDTDDGIWRRIHLIPFTRTVAPADRDPNLTAKLCSELPGILNWAIEGCRQWQRDGGMVSTPTLDNALLEYRSEEDIFNAFVQEVCIVDPAVSTPRTEIWCAFDTWVKVASAKAKPNRNRFYAELLRLGFRTVNSNGQRCVKGLKVGR